jgi:signal transduction histidine kinase
LALMVRLAQKTLGGAPGAEPILGRLAEELAAALTELRELARGIHPATLTEHGLGPALEALAARSPVPVELEFSATERLPASVEATAYYVVAEALTNVAKYAGAGRVTVCAGIRGDQLAIEVRDDGVGGASLDRGTGLRGLADRVEAVRGSLRLESPPGRGTTVSATIPVGAGPATG